MPVPHHVLTLPPRRLLTAGAWLGFGALVLGLGLLAWTVKVGGNVVCGPAWQAATSLGGPSSDGEPEWKATATDLISRCESAARPYVWSGAFLSVLGTVLLGVCLYLQLRLRRTRTSTALAER